uniref:Uncharacterized protein n=1 Tax=Solanum tuberosum TaxID=4113 RepID=M1CAD5_SOLTU
MKMLQYYIVVKPLALYIGVCISYSLMDYTGYDVVLVPYDPRLLPRMSTKYFPQY